MQKDLACPHCGAMAGASPDDELRYVCDVCGAPRIPTTTTASTGRELAPLKRAERARRSRAGWRAAAAGGGALSAFALMILAGIVLLFGIDVPLAILGLVVTGSLLAFTTWAALKARAKGHAIGPALDAAWLVAATDFAQRTKGPITATNLAAALGVEEPQAEELLALLDVNDVVRSDVTDDGDIAYSSRLRVDPGITEQAAEAEARAEAEAEADAGAAAKTMVASKR